jgi:hypothetical protein
MDNRQVRSITVALAVVPSIARFVPATVITGDRRGFAVRHGRIEGAAAGTE